MKAQRSAIAHAPVPGVRVESVLGPVKMEYGEARRVRIGPFEFETAPVAVAPRGIYNLGFPGDALVGYEVLAQFVMRLDYRRERIWLRRNDR